jgi:hypothetical protein
MGAAVVAIVAVAAFGAAIEARAAPTAGSVCTSFSLSGLKYQWSAIGSVSCNQAKPWLLELLADHLKANTSVGAVANAPKGFHCRATGDSKGRPWVGTCYTGTLAFPKNGFQWYAG